MNEVCVQKIKTFLTASTYSSGCGSREEIFPGTVIFQYQAWCILNDINYQISLYCIGSFKSAQGPYTNYVDKILKIFDPPHSVDKFTT